MADVIGSDPKQLMKLFYEYLMDQDAISRDKLSKPIKLLNEIDRRIGQRAVLKGYLSLSDVYRILADSFESHVPFGASAVKRGLLTDAQVAELVGLQTNIFDLFVVSLELTGALEPEPLQKHVRSFLAAHNIKPTTVVGKPLAAPPQKKIGGDTEAASTVRILSVQDLQGREQRLWEMLRKVKGLATLPAVVERILRMLENQNVKIQELVKAIQVDPGLSAALLRIANSAYYVRRGKVTELDRVIVTLGLAGIKQFIMATAVVNKFKGVKAEAAKIIWRHSVFTGHWAQALSKQKKLRLSEQEIFVAGRRCAAR